MRDLLIAAAGFGRYSGLPMDRVWPLVRRIDKRVPITLMAKLMDDVVRQHRSNGKPDT